MTTECAFSFDFTVNRSFLFQGDHPITFRKRSHDRLVAVIGAIRHSSRPVRVVNAVGREMDGRIRHSTTGGNDYYQLNCNDSEITSGLLKGDVVMVDLVGNTGRPEVRLRRP